ncbi:MAG: FG-GAP repeat domain-containing protein [Pyrinomonadaceae bacterium]
MKNNKIRTIKTVVAAFIVTVTLHTAAFPAQVNRTASGANPAAIQATVDQFRADLGGSNNGVGGSFKAGRREINWDGVPDSFSAPNFFPANFFNSNSPRGAVFSSSRTFNNSNSFIVSADASNPTATAVEFGDIDPSYPANFIPFSNERLFISRNNNVTTIEFFIPGTRIPATVKGFGVVFTDVDQAGPTFMEFYREDGTVISFLSAPVFNNGLSFVGVSFNAGERISKVEIVSGSQVLANGNLDGAGGDDIVAMDDFIYGEPRAREFHEGDFDGDGFKDPAVFRPSAGVFFVLNTGSSTVDSIPFGIAGDVPVEGDFDGDQRADVAIFRPNTGEWWIQKSSDNTISALQFGQSGDKPQPGDFDKDGKTDVAFWRPSNGNYFVLRSSNNSFFAFPWGANGDVPIGSPDVP